MHDNNKSVPTQIIRINMLLNGSAVHFPDPIWCLKLIQAILKLIHCSKNQLSIEFQKLNFFGLNWTSKSKASPATIRGFCSWRIIELSKRGQLLVFLLLLWYQLNFVFISFFMNDTKFSLLFFFVQIFLCLIGVHNSCVSARR